MNGVVFNMGIILLEWPGRENKGDAQGMIVHWKMLYIRDKKHTSGMSKDRKVGIHLREIILLWQWELFVIKYLSLREAVL